MRLEDLMTREELIEMAQAARKRGAFQVISQEELDALPVKQEEKYITASTKKFMYSNLNRKISPIKKCRCSSIFTAAALSKGGQTGIRSTAAIWRTVPDHWYGMLITF